MRRVSGPGIIQRPRLLDVLLDSRAPLTVVRGPAGSGKSTLVAQWLEQAPPDGVVLWHTRDDPVGTRSSYWIDLIEDLARHRLISRASALHWNQSLLQSDYTRRAVRGALEDIGAPITLVLENFGPPGTHWEGIASDIVGLLEAMPSVSVVTIGRAATALEDVAAAVTVGTTLILGDELLLDGDEAGRVARARGVPGLGSAALTELLASSERLMLPFRFALESARRAPGATPAAGSWLDGYSRELVRRLQSEGLLEFAGVVAQAPYATAGLADAIAGTHDSGSMLAALEEAGVGTISVDHDGEEVFRFTGHARPLVGDAYRAKHPDAARRAQAEVARWLADRGSPTAAIEYAVRGDDLEHASELLARHFTELSAEQGELLVELFGQVERSRVRRYPTISMAFALMLNARSEGRLVAADYFISAAVGARLGTGQPTAVEQFLLAGQEAIALRVLGRIRAATNAVRRMGAADERLTDADRAGLGMTYPQLVGQGAITLLYARDLAAARRGFERELAWGLREGYGGRVNTALGAPRVPRCDRGPARGGRGAPPAPPPRGLAARLGRRVPGLARGRRPRRRPPQSRRDRRGDRGARRPRPALLDDRALGFIAAQRALAVAADGAPTLALTEFDHVLATRGAKAPRAVLEAFDADATREFLAALAGEPMGGSHVDGRSRQSAQTLAIRAVREALAGRWHRASEFLARAGPVQQQPGRRPLRRGGGRRRHAPLPGELGIDPALRGAHRHDRRRERADRTARLLPEEDREAVLAELERREQAEGLRETFSRFTAHSVGPGQRRRSQRSRTRRPPSSSRAPPRARSSPGASSSP